MWGVMRNEDGDDSGFGSRIFFASKSSYYQDWQLFPANASDPNIFESPRMFAHDGELYLIARRDLNPPFQRASRLLPFTVQKYINLAEYSERAHTTALWKLNRQTKTLEWIIDLPGCGDTAFPSILKIGPKRYLVANYSSPLKHTNWSWIHGQTSSEGTQIYLIEIVFA